MKIENRLNEMIKEKINYVKILKSLKKEWYNTPITTMFYENEISKTKEEIQVLYLTKSYLIKTPIKKTLGYR